jgi:glycosyltransferase
MSNNSKLISIITTVKNGERYIEKNINSVRTQTFSQYEHILIDGNSSDSTMNIVNKHFSHFSCVISENDAGIYDGINKGIERSRGEIVGLLNCDDFFYDENILTEVNKIFNQYDVDVVYGDLIYLRKNSELVSRNWRAGHFKKRSLLLGWMPPHPTVFFRKSLLTSVGPYNLDYKISADYDFLIRLFKIKNLKCFYLNQVLVVMRSGGVSNSSITQILKKTREDYRILKRNHIGGIFTLICKNFRKISQFL